MSLNYEQQFYSEKVKLIAGTDEAGRGCLLGPVVAAAVILPRDFKCDLINDSKKLNEKQREEAYQIIIDNAIAYGVYSVSPSDIDKMNILEASRFAMEQALKNMNHDYDFVVTDYMELNHEEKPYVALAHGDALCQCVAAASIIAKVTRDRTCVLLDKVYPEYHIAKNKGYGTKDHLEALEKYGPVEGLHRFSYKPVKQALIKKVSLF